MMTRRSPEEKFWDRVQRGPDDPDSCWTWTGARDRDGYGKFTPIGGRGPKAAHRYAYELLVRSIPFGSEIDHLCRNRGCVNPAHLEPVTHRENIRRGESPSARSARRTHCRRGHELSGSNLIVRSLGYRRCRTCESAREQARTPRARVRRPARRDPVTPVVRLAVLERDGGCLAVRIGGQDPASCAGPLTLDHVKSEPRMGVRAPSDARHLATVCRGHHIDTGWATANRPLLRSYLEGV